ncbi:MAG: YkgJ family cysteine cluster protein [Rhodocyclaceae bacterium]
MDRRFLCTECGKCCFGWLPLTLGDALTNAARFPLALVWTAVPQGARTFSLTTRLGISIKLPKRKQIAAAIAPTAYLPPTFPCPELTAAGRCGIHEHKPLRCRTMPFYPWREEDDQAELLVPRKGWECDTSAAAPVVYHDKRIVDRRSFDLERRELLAQAATMQAYADYALKYMPWIVDSLVALAQKGSGSLVTSLSSFLTAIKTIDAAAVAAQQLPVLRHFEARTNALADLAEYHRNYAGWAREMAYLAKPKAG